MSATNCIQKLALTATAILFTLAVPVCAGAAGVSVNDAGKTELDAAKDPYGAGVEAMNSGRYQEAADKFRESYNIVASPNSRLMLGRALVKMHRPIEAFRELEETVSQANELADKQKKYEKTAEAARKELEDLKAELGFVTVIPGSDVRLAGKQLSASDWGKPQPVIPGIVILELTGSDGRKVEKELRVDAGTTKVLTADLTATSSYSHRDKPKAEANKAKEPEQAGPTPVLSPSRAGVSPRTIGYVCGAVGLAGIGAFLGLTAVADSTFGDLKGHCTATTCSTNAVDNAETKGRYEGMGYAGLGIGLVGIGLGVFLVLSDKSESSDTALHLGPGSIALHQKF
jgi:hypothetical protein